MSGCFLARRKAQDACQITLQQQFRLTVFSRRNNNLPHKGADVFVGFQAGFLVALAP